MKKILTLNDINQASLSVARQIDAHFSHLQPTTLLIYGVPRGGLNAAFHVIKALEKMGIDSRITYKKGAADCFVDDLVDSGATRKKYKHHGKPFFVLFDKRTNPSIQKQWLIFPWEEETEASGPTDAVIRMLQYIGEDPNREGLVETPKRVVKAWDEWFAGYKAPEDSKILKCFEDGAEGTDEMIVVRGIPYTSYCEHHIAPFTGTASIAYVPDGKIVGLSKFNRLVEKYSRRLQVQERMTTQLANAIQWALEPAGVAVLIQGSHSCVCSRGVKHTGSDTVTSKLTGVFKKQQATRAEFFSLCK